MPINESPYQFLQKYTEKTIRVEFRDIEGYEGKLTYEGILYRMEHSEHEEGIENILLKNAKNVDQNEEISKWLLIRGNIIAIIYFPE